MSDHAAPPQAPTGWSVDERGVSVPRSADADATYDVLLNQQHVWSLLPRRDARAAGLGRRAPWPTALRPHLVGRAEVLVRHHLTGEVLSTRHLVFGDDPSVEVSVTNEAGRSLILDKWGRLSRPMSNQTPEILEELLDATERILDVLDRKAGVPGFICYGTLLGAVRSGGLIGHDNDIDLAYVSDHLYPVDVVREGYRVERALLSEGFAVRRGSGVRLNVRIPLSDGATRCIDVFTAHWVEGVLYIPSDTGFALPRETILPLGTVELMGRPLPAPAQPERLLAATYGEGWRVPDPAFKYDTPRGLSRRLNGWFGGLITQRKHWDSFYARDRSRIPHTPSPFARWVAKEYPSDRPLVDLGTGTGRDALWFARRQRRRVIAFDYNLGAVRRGERTSRTRGLDADFRIMNLYDTRAVLTWGALLSREEQPVDLYARFTLHGLSRPGQDNLIRLASMALRRGGLLFLEFRTLKDRGQYHVFADHRRYYQRPRSVRARIEESGGRVVAQISGTGMAPFGDEDPQVCRIVASWDRT